MSDGDDRRQRAIRATALRNAAGRTDENPMDYQHLITIEPDKRSGQPCIRGLRMTVQDVLEYLAAGMTPDEILADFPDLTAEDIRACLAFTAGPENLS
jgi:uncharacterized protein (DUF433 family)